MSGHIDYVARATTDDTHDACSRLRATDYSHHERPPNIHVPRGHGLSDAAGMAQRASVLVQDITDVFPLHVLPRLLENACIYIRDA